MESDPTHPPVEITGIPPPPRPAPLEKISSKHNICLTKLDGTAPKHETEIDPLELADLFQTKPVPQPMTEESARELIPKVDGWNLMNENGLLKLKKSWKIASFPKLLEMFELIAFSRGGHSPKVHVVGFYDVTIEIWTHAAGGLTENDFTLAAKINAIDMNHLTN